MVDLDALRRVAAAAAGTDRASLITAAADEIGALRAACVRTEHEVQQVLGKAIGYPWHKDDQGVFPGATAADGVCVGPHTGVTLADEAAALIVKLRAECATLRRQVATGQPVRAAGVRTEADVVRDFQARDDFGGGGLTRD